MIEPLRFKDDALEILDQRQLPHTETWLTCKGPADVVEAVRTMAVRGAPAIGVAAAYGVALAARQHRNAAPDVFRAKVGEAGAALTEARPTAINLAWGVAQALAAVDGALEGGASPAEAADAVLAAAGGLRSADVAANQAIGQHGSLLIPDGARVLTHCNAGALATAGYGTALGLVRHAVADGKSVTVIADETRPVLQGARLTSWELQQDGIPVVLITDSMAGALMAKGEIDLVVVGADRIARNGDVANKIGTYTAAVLARRHGVPFYVAAPISTLDPACPDGSAIPIEERDPSEVTHLLGQAIAPAGVTARNLAFDVTPAELVTAIVTEKGIHRPPYARSLAQALGLGDDEARGEAGSDEGAAPGETGTLAVAVAVATTATVPAADASGDDPGSGDAPAATDDEDLF